MTAKLTQIKITAGNIREFIGQTKLYFNNRWDIAEGSLIIKRTHRLYYTICINYNIIKKTCKTQTQMENCRVNLTSKLLM